MSAFLAFAFDVPRRLARGKLLWVFLVLAVLWLVVPILLGTSTDSSGEKQVTLAGNPWLENGPGAPPTPPEEMLAIFVGGLFGIFLACYAGPFAGLVLLADSVSQAFAPGSAEVNVPKPVARSTILLARHVGALLISLGFILLLILGSTGIAYARTQVFALRVLWCIPVAFVLFGLLHAIGSAAAVATRNAFVGAFLALGVWFLGTITQWVALLGKGPFKASPVLSKVALASGWAHRILPRANELPSLGEALITGGKWAAFGDQGTQPIGFNWEVRELITQTLVWWGVALGLACLSVRKRDF